MDAFHDDGVMIFPLWDAYAKNEVLLIVSGLRRQIDIDVGWTHLYVEQCYQNLLSVQSVALNTVRLSFDVYPNRWLFVLLNGRSSERLEFGSRRYSE